MKTHIIRIGNSQGVRIPRLLIEQARLGTDVELHVLDDSIVITPVKARPRSGWETAFQEMAERGDDALIDNAPPISTRWDEERWEW
jgi:antitoxin MazE